MFEPQDTPRIFALPCGVDFAKALVDGLNARFQAAPPEAIARATLIVNTTRMQRRVTEVFDRGAAQFLPKLQLLTALKDPTKLAEDEVVSPLARRLELVELVRGLLAQDPSLAPKSAAFDLANSLAGVMDELRDEGIHPNVITALDVTDESGHWQRAQKFLSIVTQYFDASAPSKANQDASARQALAIDALIASWQSAPPQDPILIAGSTASRGTARRLMEAVSRLPRGAVILPGMDMEMPPRGWNSLRTTKGLQEDHPQYRLMAFCDALDVRPETVPAWHTTPAPSPARNALVSLALRPAPVTHAWRDEGPDLKDLANATEALTLVEAQSQREEALAIALRLRKAAEDGESAALISPDRTLTRLTTALLDQWGIVPDDSAGIPLHLTPPGRFLRHIAEVAADRLTSERLLILLKHPLCHSGAARNEHLRHTRDFELHLRRHGPPFPEAQDLLAFGAAYKAEAWSNWLVDALALRLAPETEAPLPTRVANHRALAERFAAGSQATGDGNLWGQLAGIAARDLFQNLEDAADAGGAVTAADYLSLFAALIASEQQTDRDAGDPLIRIWGTLEARVMGTDLLILGGLNEGTWPEAPAPDPWLNRALRKQAGMRLPERRIGLSAHDFQQAIGAPQVWVTRALRADGAQTVPSRWLNRLTNMLAGLEAGRPALEKMRARGSTWIDRARQFERVESTNPAPRPSPRPPRHARPPKLSVTQIGTLLRDPYAVYARHVLGLKPLDPLVVTADAAMRGTVMHEVFEHFVRDDPLTEDALRARALLILEDMVPWPDIRALWLSRIERITAQFVEEEMVRQCTATPSTFEKMGFLRLDPLGFTLSAKADRIDRRADGTLVLFDYKTGSLPTDKQEKAFDKQLLLMAAIAEAGGFEDVPAALVARAAYLGVGLTPETRDAPLDDVPVARTRAELETLITAMQSADFGFTARRAMVTDRHGSDYDQLARFGEWDTTDAPVTEDVT